MGSGSFAAVGQSIVSGASKNSITDKVSGKMPSVGSGSSALSGISKKAGSGLSDSSASSLSNPGSLISSKASGASNLIGGSDSSAGKGGVFTGISKNSPDTSYTSNSTYDIDNAAPLNTDTAYVSDSNYTIEPDSAYVSQSTPLVVDDAVTAREKYGPRGFVYYPEITKFKVSIDDIDDSKLESISEISDITIYNNYISNQEGGALDSKHAFSTDKTIPIYKFTIPMKNENELRAWASHGANDKRSVSFTYCTTDRLEVYSVVLYDAFVKQCMISPTSNSAMGMSTTYVIYAGSYEIDFPQPPSAALPTPEPEEGPVETDGQADEEMAYMDEESNPDAERRTDDAPLVYVRQEVAAQQPKVEEEGKIAKFIRYAKKVHEYYTYYKTAKEWYYKIKNGYATFKKYLAAVNQDLDRMGLGKVKRALQLDKVEAGTDIVDKQVDKVKKKVNEKIDKVKDKVNTGLEYVGDVTGVTKAANTLKELPGKMVPDKVKEFGGKVGDYFANSAVLAQAKSDINDNGDNNANNNANNNDNNNGNNNDNNNGNNNANNNGNSNDSLGDATATISNAASKLEGLFGGSGDDDKK